jgi:hypothetical protein
LPDFSDDDDAGEPAMDRIFTMNGWLFPVYELGGGMAEALDAIDADSEVYVSLTDDTGELRDEYQTGFGPHFVAVDRAALARTWRGVGGLGRYVAGSGLLMLRDLATCIALHPSPFELHEKHDGEVPEAEWTAGVRKLTDLWLSLGGDAAPGGNIVFDPTLVHLPEAVDRLYESLSA